MKVYTKRGDDGTTGLLYGGRVDKDDLRTSAYGTVDETVSALGMARAAVGEGQQEWAEAILVVQRELFVVGAQQATHVKHWPKLVEGVSLTTPAKRQQLLPDESPLRYLNRLSDYLYVLARAVEDGLITPTRG